MSRDSSPLAGTTAILTCALIGLACWETASTWWQHDHVPNSGHWAAAAAKLQQLRQPSDAILSAPSWIDPLVRLHLGSDLRLDDVGLSDVDRFHRVFELSIRRARHPWLRTLQPKQQWHYGEVTLSLFEKPAAQPLYDFRDHLAQARIDLVGSSLTNCRNEGQRFVCDPARPWAWVGPHLAEVDHQPYHCLYAHPIAGQLLRITFSNVSLGSHLVIYTGIDDFEHRKQAQQPVLTQIFVDQRLVGSILHHNDRPWTRWKIDTHQLDPGTHRVRFEISAERDLSRSFCFHAEARQ